MSKVITVAAGIAATLRASSEFAVVYDLPSPQPESKSATVVPSGGDSGVAHHDELRFTITVAVSPNDFTAGLSWLFSAPEIVRDILEGDPSCGGVCSAVHMQSWGSAYVSSMAGVDLLALDITLTPTYARP